MVSQMFTTPPDADGIQYVYVGTRPSANPVDKLGSYRYTTLDERAFDAFPAGERRVIVADDFHGNTYRAHTDADATRWLRAQHDERERRLAAKDSEHARVVLAVLASERAQALGWRIIGIRVQGGDVDEPVRAAEADDPFGPVTPQPVTRPVARMICTDSLCCYEYGHQGEHSYDPSRPQLLEDGDAER